MHLDNWIALAEQGSTIVGLEYHSPDRTHLLQQFYRWGQQQRLSTYLWNPGYDTLQQLVEQQGTVWLQSTSIGREQDILQALSTLQDSGVFLLEGVLKLDTCGQLNEKRIYQMINAHYQARTRTTTQHWILLESYIQLPSELQPLIPILSDPLPSQSQVQGAVNQFCRTHEFSINAEEQNQLVRSCQGLPLGEIELLLVRLLDVKSPIEQVCQQILQHKITKLKGKGIELIAQPDVDTAGGLDLLTQHLDRVTALLNPEAQSYGLTCPRGMILWGTPGTGKSLSAKLAAKKMGVPLLAGDWGAILSSTQPDRTLRELLQLAEAMSPVVLYWDDFDKGFAGWDSNQDGGIARRLSGKLLTWMQEHRSPIFMVATVNRLGMLPAELIRRFDDVFFCGLPTEGARYDVFNLHLAKYFPAFQAAQISGISPFTDEQWRILLRDYKICTPAEIGRAVRKTAEEIYYRHQCQGNAVEALQVTLNDLLEQRWQFTPAMVREEKQMYEILNQATFARPASGCDRSKFAIPPQELFGED